MGEWILLGRWWLIIELLGLVTFPILAFAARALADRGYCVAKAVGILLFSYIVWIISSLKLMKYGYASVLLALLIIGALSWYLNRKNFRLKEMPLKKMAVVDLIFLAAFVLFAVILRHKPDLYFAYSEDFVDFAFTQALLRADYFPPVDPWLAQNPLAYYYGGFLLAANLVRITHIPASFASNFVVATFFGLAVTAAYGLVADLTRSKWFGLLSAFMVCGLGYLSGAFQFIAALTKHDFMGYKPLITATWKDWLLTYNFWDADRIIPGTLNYYPYFSFLQSDMHPPTLSFPLQITFMVLVVAFVKRQLPRTLPDMETIVLGLLMALSLGFLFFVHSWDFPIYVMALGLAVLLFKRSRSGFLLGGMIILGSVILFLPYDLTGVGGGFRGLGLVSDRTNVSSLLEMAGLFLFVIFTALVIMSTNARLKAYQVAVFASLGIMAVAVFKFPLLVLILPAVALPLYILLSSTTRGKAAGHMEGHRCAGRPVLWAASFDVLERDAVKSPLVPLWKRGRALWTALFSRQPNAQSPCAVPDREGEITEESPSCPAMPDDERVFLFLVLLGALVVAFAEIFYLKDALSGAVARFNTVLKLYYSVWIFWGLAAAIAFKCVLTRLKGVSKYLWLFPAVVLIVGSVIHPIASTAGWTSGRHTIFGINRGTWDGTAYLKSLYPADYDAITWIDENIKGSPVILETPGGPYSYSSRVASLTGLPTVIGWGMHEIMWRGDWGTVTKRTYDTDTIYDGHSDAQTLELLRKYNVRYVFVGYVESQKYSAGGLAKFKQRPDVFRPVYSSGGTQIYEVIYGS